MQTYCVAHKPCPRCRLTGNDRKGDNLGVFNDGSVFCFSCGYTHADSVERFKRATVDLNVEGDTQVYLPYDSVLEYPPEALEWVYQYELTVNDLLNHNVVWSNYYHRLIFPLITDRLVAYQGRYFGTEDKPKWWGEGDFKNTFNILGTNKYVVVLTEDVVSAIKLSRYVTAIPIYGCFIGQERWTRLKHLFGANRILIWLDPDKKKESLYESMLGRSLGCTARVVFSDKDPKEIPYTEIPKYLLETY